MDKILDKLMRFIVNNENVDDEQAEIIRYGLEIFIIKVSFFGAALLISLFMGSFWQYLIFIILFSMLRSYSGGYHAATRMKCFVQSMVTIAVVLFILKLVQTYTYLILPIGAIAIILGIILWFIAPVDTENKRLDDEDKNSFRKITRIVIATEVLLSVIAYFINFKVISCSAMLAIIVSGVLALIEYIPHFGGNYEK